MKLSKEEICTIIAHFNEVLLGYPYKVDMDNWSKLKAHIAALEAEIAEQDAQLAAVAAAKEVMPSGKTKNA